jgi:mono/diheme cytochrome c family protein
VPRLMSWTVGCLAAALQITAADAQGNIDAGKTPAQIFGDTCSACHRSARDLRRASASFLRAHYTTGSDEAAAMANYLAGLGGGSDPRPAASTQGQPKRAPERAPTEVAKQQQQPQQPPRSPVESAKSAPSPTPAQPKSRPGITATAQARVVPEERHAEPQPPTSPAPPAKVLEPFEE